MALDPFPGRHLHIAVFDEVSNGPEVCAWVRKPGAECAAIDASMVLDASQLFAAALVALHAEARGKLVTHGLYSEALFALSASRQISDAFRRFGASETCTRMVIMTFDDDAAARLATNISGKLVDPSSLAAGCDELAVRKAYKVTDTELRFGTLSEAIVSRIATSRL
jgi:EKC/KEOPS complex subunit CGI121/TPRKB